MGREVKKSTWTWMILSLLLSLTIIATSPPSWAEGEDEDLPSVVQAVPGHMVSSETPARLMSPHLQSKFGALEAFNSSQGTANAWKALWDKRTGRLKVLYGSKSKAYPGSPKEASMAFLKENEGVIGLGSQSLGFARERKTNIRNHTRFNQVLHGIPVEGRYVAVHSTPQGEVTMVQNGSLPDLKVENADSFPLDVAVSFAQDDLMASLPGVTIKTTKHQEKIVRNRDQYVYVWEITFYTLRPFGEWVYRIDAQTGAILSKWDALLYASGKGYAYKSNNDYWAGKISSVSLKYLFSFSEGNDGFLTGYYADAYDYYGDNVYAPDFKFFFSDDKDLFDQVQAYYHVTTFHDWWDKTFVGPYGLGVIPYFNDSGSSTPLMINVPPSWSNMGDNAFYTPSFDNYFNAGRPGPGIVFGDQFTRQDGTYAEDKTEDQDVVYHEFTHGMMDWLGHEANFSGTPHHYERSMGEGNSDYWACSYTKSPDWADVMAGNWERPLNNTWVYPWYVGCAGNFSGGGITEEHCTGRIWGGFLWDIKTVLKNSADKYIFESLDYFDPDGGHVPNEGDFGDAAWAMLMAEADLHGNLNNSMKVYGAAVSRGIFSLDYYSHSSNYLRTGHGGADWQNIAYWIFSGPGKIATSGNVLNEKDDHFYFFEINDSLWVDVSVNSSFIVPFCTVRQVLGDYDSGYDVSGSLSDVYSETSTTTKLRTDYLEPGLYVVWLNGDFDTTGSYKITISIKR